MTTKVIIELGSNEHAAVKVTTIHAKTKDPFGYSPIVQPGGRVEVYVHTNQSLLIEEVPCDNTAKGEEQASGN